MPHGKQGPPLTCRETCCEHGKGLVKFRMTFRGQGGWQQSVSDKRHGEQCVQSKGHHHLIAKQTS